MCKRMYWKSEQTQAPYRDTALKVPLPTLVIRLSEKYSLLIKRIPRKLLASSLVSLLWFI